MRRALLAGLMIVGLVGGAQAGAEQHEAAVDPPADAVVAFVDTGINPYHETFRDTSERAYRHPSTYLPGFPEDAEALQLTLDAGSYEDAVRADCETVWQRVERGKLYWFPGTKIVGGITFLTSGAVTCGQNGPTSPRILDVNGHGTMVASRGASVEYGACPGCRIVAVQFPTSIPLLNPSGSTGPAVEAIRWAAENNGWIDIQTNSWGPFAPLWDPTGQAGLLTANPELVRAVEEVSAAQMAFWASGNGAAFRGGVAGHPTFLVAHFTPSAVMVGGHDSGHVNTWPGFPPHVVSDSCDSWAAEAESLDESGDRVGGGTSAASPFAAGGAARLLLEARAILGDDATGVDDEDVVARGPAGLVASGPLEDGVLTRDEWRELVFKTATARPEGQHEDGPPCGPGPYGPTPVAWKDVPDAYPEYVHIGYGAVDAPALGLGLEVLRGQQPLPDRSATDAYFAEDRRLRETTHLIFRGP